MILVLLVCGKDALNLKACCRESACLVAPGLEIPDLISPPFRYMPYPQRHDLDPEIRTWVVKHYPHLEPQSAHIGRDSMEYIIYAASISKFRNHLKKLSCVKEGHRKCSDICPTILKTYLENQCHLCPVITTIGNPLSPDAICKTHYCPNIECFPLYAGLVTAFTSPDSLQDQLSEERLARKVGCFSLDSKIFVKSII